MFRLVLNDWIVTRRWLVAIFLYFTTIQFLTFSFWSTRILVNAGIFHSTLLLVAIFLVEENSHVNIFNRALPLRQSQLILARMLSAWSAVFFLMTYAFCFQVVGMLMQAHTTPRILGNVGVGFLVQPLTSWLCACGILFAILFPVFFGFGKMKGILIGFGIAGWILFTTSPFSFEPVVVRTAHQIGSAGMFALAFLLVIALQLLSYIFSSWLFKRREF